MLGECEGHYEFEGTLIEKYGRCQLHYKTDVLREFLWLPDGADNTPLDITGLALSLAARSEGHPHCCRLQTRRGAMKSIRLLCMTVLLGFWSCSVLAADWKVGIARIDITPEKPVWMAGYASRDHLPEGTIHRLWAKALVIEDSAGSRLAIVTTDLIGMPQELGDAVCARVKKSTGIDRSRVLLNFSHTHSGPVVPECAPVAYGLTSEQHSDAEAYARTLQDGLVKVIEAASADLQPAQLAYGEGEATFAINRRAKRTSEDGRPLDRSTLVPVDHSVPVLRVTDTQDKLVAVLFGYACHNTTTSIYDYNGDYAGYAQIALEAAYPDATALFMIGCGGDSNPDPRGKIELAEQHGKSLAAAVERALDGKLQAVDGSLTVAYEVVDLPVVDPPTKDELEERRGQGSKYDQRLTERLLTRLEEEGSIPATVPCPIQVIRFGENLSMVAIAGEAVIDYALRLKKEFAGERLWVASYSNGVPAYIPSERVLKEGGYEGATAMVYFGIHGPFQPGVEDRVVGAVRRLMNLCRWGK